MRQQRALTPLAIIWRWNREGESESKPDQTSPYPSMKKHNLRGQRESGHHKCSTLTCLIPYEDSLLTRHTRRVWFAVTLTPGSLNSGHATVLTRPAMAGVRFIQILLEGPFQVQLFHRGTGYFLDQFIQRC